MTGISFFASHSSKMSISQDVSNRMVNNLFKILFLLVFWKFLILAWGWEFSNFWQEYLFLLVILAKWVFDKMSWIQLHIILLKKFFLFVFKVEFGKFFILPWGWEFSNYCQKYLLLLVIPAKWVFDKMYRIESQTIFLRFYFYWFSGNF